MKAKRDPNMKGIDNISIRFSKIKLHLAKHPLKKYSDIIYKS